MTEPPHLIDVIPDELTLARAQLDAGLPALAEGTLERRIGWLQAQGRDAADELDAARLLLAEALWRQQRPLAAREALEAMRQGSVHRRRPIALLVEAEALAASGEPDRAAGVMERVVAAVGIDEAWRLRAGVASRLPWPLPAELRPAQRRPQRSPWSAEPEPTPAADETTPVDESRSVAARARLEEARSAYAGGDLEAGDRELSLAVRLDPGVAAEAVGLVEPTLGEQPVAGRLLLYGDVLRAAGREEEAQRAYARAAEGG
jgi:tetratricopeptide (TPR) repeat protein